MLMENIIKYYVEEIMEYHGCSQEEAKQAIEDALQSNEIENKIMGFIHKLLNS